VKELFITLKTLISDGKASKKMKLIYVIGLQSEASMGAYPNVRNAERLGLEVVN